MATATRIFLIIGFATLSFSAAQAGNNGNNKLIPLQSTELLNKFKETGVKATIVNLWASWCAPCKSEMPELVHLRHIWTKRGLQLILVSGDSMSDLPDAIQFLDQLKVDFPTYHVAEPPDQFMKQLAKDWPATVPTTLVFNSRGERTATWYGRFKLKDLEVAVNKAIVKSAKPQLATPGKFSSDKDQLSKGIVHGKSGD